MRRGAVAMKLVLDGVTQRVGADTHLYPLNLALVPGALTVLLGATRSGKTTLMRIMAGLDAPASGRVLVDGVDVTGRPVRERNIAMVYQQFINYPSLTVAENIASPLRRQRAASGRGGTVRGTPVPAGAHSGVNTPLVELDDIDKRVQAIATRLRIDPYLTRLPAELSGGQQQRVALARALAKRAPLMLLDEPLVNLDYKLREELRDELTQLFMSGESTVVYATTDPTEALLLGGYTAVLDGGELLQYGPTADVFHTPSSLRVARAFSDPPMNLIPATLGAAGVSTAFGTEWPLAQAIPHARGGPCTVGLRPSALRLQSRPNDVQLAGTVALAEIAGSDTFVHVHTAAGTVVAQLQGVHVFSLGEVCPCFFDPTQLYVFGPDGALRHAPRHQARPDATRGSH